MPAIIIDNHGIEAVARAGAFLEDLLRVADSVKQTHALEPPLVESDFENIEEQFNSIYDSEQTSNDAAETRIQRFAIIETAVRETCKNLVATTPIESPDFVRVWNLFDILSILSDKELCDPALLLWLVEELLDSQTIVGCRKIFDFLESRREKITSKHFGQKKLVILRACNELARRLSRHLDPAFAGRILIFMFQSFPLGDKSAVNLRGEYHVENVTTFDQDPPKLEEDADKMDVDVDVGTPNGSRREKSNGAEEDKKPLDPDALYPVFWALQESFNQPKRLFEANNFASFKTSIETTMTAFLTIKDEQPRNKERQEKLIEDLANSLKRRRVDGEDTLANGFNAKYLTSRDLFKLEISDLAFRRNILIQVLIIMDFLLALSPAAKKKLSQIENPNKSAIYPDQQLSDEDLEWVVKTKDSIMTYLKQGFEGPYFVRLLETVLARDKNWVWWKAEGCPPIELPRLSPDLFVKSMNSAGKLATTKRLRATPMGSLSLDFLSDDEEEKNLAKLMNPERYRFPSLDVFKNGIADDQFEIDMSRNNNEALNAAVEGKASKTWRALRIASKFKLAAFDKIQDDEKIDAIFEEAPAEKDDDGQEEEVVNGEAVFPEDRRPIVVVDASPGSALAKQLITQHSRTFTKVAVHVTRKAAEGEVNGQDYHFVDTQAFNMLRDGDQFLEFSDEGDNIHGTSRKVVDSITDNDRIAVMVMDKDGAQQVKDNGFDARFIFIQPPVTEILEAQLKQGGLSEETIQQAVKAASEAAEHASNNPDFYHSGVEAEFKTLESVIFGSEVGVGETSAAAAPTDDGDVAMTDGDVAAPAPT
ncbi:THO complex subunit 1 transcription elongation factor-domain-containing protein [Podospora fimiseda]|uniref:THO complex subunit 1 transcription elongation factor-domain-containing protein n=1 Tax=Podospora fimiseda TaxID=252190 RepID=A0AAN7GSR1_9PEZI|nr:THO complex subunit 1 transcription elongation factor-domain-containing protein [Podospora fimiseda]